MRGCLAGSDIGALLPLLHVGSVIGGWRLDGRQCANRDPEQRGVRELHFSRNTSRNPIRNPLHCTRRIKPKQSRKTCWATVVGNDFGICHAQH